MSTGSLNFNPEYRRRLPHIQPEGATFFITYRLHGSVPRSVMLQCITEKQALQTRSNTLSDTQLKKQTTEYNRRWFGKIESILDGSAAGPDWLRDDRIAAVVSKSWHDRDGVSYALESYCVMPNHAHVVFRHLKKSKPVAAIMHEHKGYTANQCNRLLKRTGQFWEHESYDHVVRDEQEFNRITKYVLNNPVKAGLVDSWDKWRWTYCKNMSSKKETGKL